MPRSTRMLFQTEPHSYVVDASELGLKPGEWPGVLDFGTDFGNGQLFLLDRAAGVNAGAKYKQVLGCLTLTVFND